RAGVVQPAAVLLDDRSADRQAQAQPARPPRRLGAALLEHVEDPRQHLGLDPDPRVDDADDQRPRGPPVVGRAVPAAPLAVPGADYPRAAAPPDPHPPP